MTTRRRFLGTAMATGLWPVTGWAALGAPAYLAAAATPEGRYRLFGLSSHGTDLFDVALPGRGHAAAAHPWRAEAVAFARRPGRFALVLDCQSGQISARLDSPPNRHFYGHGAYSPDGRILYTTENDLEVGTGCIGLWDADNGYARVGEFPSGGIGPHDMATLPDGTLVIANGGIATHPESGRSKLNLPTMRPSLAYIEPDGTMQDDCVLPARWHRNSIRHLAIRPDGLVAFAMQWQGDWADNPPVFGLHRRGQAPLLAPPDTPSRQALRGYAGSIAFSGAGKHLAITSPRGNVVQIQDIAMNSHPITRIGADICGAATTDHGFMVSSGRGLITQLSTDGTERHQHHKVQWDNHLIAIT